jgi:hypothetical protein
LWFFHSLFFHLYAILNFKLSSHFSIYLRFWHAFFCVSHVKIFFFDFYLVMKIWIFRVRGYKIDFSYFKFNSIPTSQLPYHKLQNYHHHFMLRTFFLSNFFLSPFKFYSHYPQCHRINFFLTSPHLQFPHFTSSLMMSRPTTIFIILQNMIR